MAGPPHDPDGPLTPDEEPRGSDPGWMVSGNVGGFTSVHWLLREYELMISGCPPVSVTTSGLVSCT